ncbi:MFS general substrate transporter [Hypoxylon sp. FL1150]|nr:MFS general substrate transporter [Hypoxylon sp. FL1150]
MNPARSSSALDGADIPVEDGAGQIGNSRHDKDTEKGGEIQELEEGSEGSKGRSIRGVRWMLVFTAIYTTCFLYGLDTTIAADIQGPIAETLSHVDQLAWVRAGFPLGSVCVILLLGRLYNTFNTKRKFVITVVLFEVGSAVCGSAPSMSAMIVGRVVAGMGGSGICLGSLQYVSLMTGEKERGFYTSLVGAFWGVGSVLGPVIGGAFVESSATWRWAFYVNLPIGALTIPASIISLPLFLPVKGLTIRERLGTIDFAGFLVGCGTWQYFAVLTTPDRRLFPGHLLRNRTQVLLSVVTAAGAMTMFVIIYYIPIYFQFVNGDGAVMAAVRQLPFVCIAVTVSISAGSFLHFIKVYMVIYLIADILLVAGGGPLMVYLNLDSETGLIYGLTVIIAAGCGLSMTTAYTIATLTLEPNDVGAGLNMHNVAQIGAQVIALAIAGQIYQSTGKKNLSAVIAIARAMQTTLALVPVTGGIMVISALCMKREKLFN